MVEVHIQPARTLTPADADVEIVERKGVGHPDTICDQVMERISQVLCQTYRERFGSILHHNCDKGLLVAGSVERRFGGGRIVEPMRMIIGGRATASLGAERIDVREIAIETAKTWFRQNLQHVDPDEHVDFQVELKPGSPELRNLFLHGTQKVLGANDTSAAVGYAPLTETERLVLEAEQYLNSKDFKDDFQDTGQDVKIMAVREKRRMTLTVAMPFLDRYLDGETAYFERKAEVVDALNKHLRRNVQSGAELTINLNALDHAHRGIDGIYVSVLGTSAEDADSGQVGRGNKVNGLIALHRPGGAEAAAGKNPVSHVGKIYNVLSHLLARKLHEQISEIRQVTVWLCSRIGEPIDQPAVVAIETRVEPGAVVRDVESPVTRIVEEELGRMPAFCDELIRGEHPVC